MRTVPFGAWPSPISASSLVQGASAVGEVRVDGHDVWWSEQRPHERGRTQLVRRTPDGACHDLFPPIVDDGGGGAGPEHASRAWNARTAYLEYGGGAWAVRDGVVVFADWADQRLHRWDPGADRPVALTPEPSVARGFRYSEPSWLGSGWLVCVRESHEPDAVASNGEAVNEVVALPLDGSAASDADRVLVLLSGADFVHSPVVDPSSPAGGPTRIAWLQWDHPRMPWDGTELWMADVARGADLAPTGVDAHLVCGGPDESVVAPGFLADGSLVACTDLDGWWAPWRWTGPRGAAPATPGPLLAQALDAEIGGPLWVGGLRWWAEVAPGRLLVTVRRSGRDQLATIEGGELRQIPTDLTEVSQVVAGRGGAVVVAASPSTEALPLLVPFVEAAPGTLLALKAPRELGIDPGWIAAPEPITFASAEGRTAHALLYRPTSPAVVGPADERPPLLVVLHGGPTSAARHRLDLAKQFWTTRGFAVVDVDYGGSTGYGRPYRRLLDGRWGEVDVQDAVAAATHLAEAGIVDGHRMAIRGGSAGGFTVLAALCFHDAFAAGASHYGIADLAALAADTHKFESRYLDGLVGPWPEARATYEARSPIHHTDGFDAPLIVLQGEEDEVVPPSQAEMIVAALAAKGVPHAYLLFPGEQHGFRQAATIVRALEAELWFYGRALGFEPADHLDPVEGAVGL